MTSCSSIETSAHYTEGIRDIPWQLRTNNTLHRTQVQFLATPLQLYLRLSGLKKFDLSGHNIYVHISTHIIKNH